MQQLLPFAVTYWNKDHIITASEKDTASLQQLNCVYTYCIVFTAFLVQILPVCSDAMLCVSAGRKAGLLTICDGLLKTLFMLLLETHNQPTHTNITCIKGSTFWYPQPVELTVQSCC